MVYHFPFALNACPRGFHRDGEVLLQTFDRDVVALLYVGGRGHILCR